MKKMTDKQQRFVEEYLIDFNATQAAIRAGYSKKTAKDIGCQNLAKLNVQEAIAEMKKKDSERLEITREYLINLQQEIIDIALGRKTVIKSEKIKNYEQEEIVTQEQTIIDLKAANAGLNQLAKMTGHDGTSKFDLTTNGKDVGSGVLIVEGLAESDEEWEQKVR